MNDRNEQNSRICPRGLRYSLALFPSMTILSLLFRSFFPGFRASFVTLAFTLLLTALVVGTVFAFRHKREMENGELRWTSAFCGLWLGIINYLILISSDDNNATSASFEITICLAISLIGYWLFLFAYKRNTSWIFRIATKSKPSLQIDKENAMASSIAFENKEGNESDMYRWLSQIGKAEYSDSFQSIGHSLKSALEMNYDDVVRVVKNKEDADAIFIHIMRSSRISQDLRDKE